MSEAETQVHRAGPRRWVLAALALTPVLAVLVGIAVVTSNDASVTFQVLPAAAVGPDPFTEPIGPVEAVEVSADAAVVISDVQQAIEADPATTALLASGDAPGLYGGTGDDDVCDAAALVAFLTANPDKAAAFAGVLGIAPDGIEDYVASLTPVVLTGDTLVTNHGFRDGSATATQAVLQAGTAVMIDATGVPRVKCNCGNPLGEPEAVDLSGAAIDGDPWDGFDTARMVRVAPGAPVGEFTLCNLRTGQMETRSAGSSIAIGSSSAVTRDGSWTLRLTESWSSTTPLPPGALDPQRCATALLAGAVLETKGTNAVVKGAAGGDLVGRVKGAPRGADGMLGIDGAPGAGALIVVERDGVPAIQLIVWLGSTTLLGSADTVDGRGIRTGDCEVGLLGSPLGSTGSPTPPPSVPAPAPPPPASTVAPSGGGGGPCDVATIRGLVESLMSPNVLQAFDLWKCDGRWAAGGITYDDQEDPFLLEWDGSAWVVGACERYVHPDDWTRSDVVPAEFWVPCISD